MKITYIDEPNLILPLAASYNTRGIAGFTQAITNADDQRKVNSMYAPVTNAITGKMTPYLCKRPGTENGGFFSNFGVTSQVVYMVAMAPNASPPTGDDASGGVLFVVNQTSTQFARPGAQLTTLISTATHAPAYVDRTQISGSDTLVLQIRSTTSVAHRAFYTSTLSWTEVTDSDFTGLQHQGKIEHLDGYSFISTLNRIYNSDLNTVSSWTPTNFISRRTQLDSGTGLARLGPQIISFGTGRMEVFRNAGNAVGSPLESLPDFEQDYGLLFPGIAGMRNYYAVLEKRLWWVGNPNGVYSYNGTTVEKVSTPGIDAILGQRQHYFVSAINCGGQRAIAIGLDQPGVSPQRSLLYFPAWKDWFEWSSTVFSPITMDSMPEITIGVSSSVMKLFRFSLSTQNFRDDGIDYTMTHQFKLPSNGNAHQKLQMFGVKGDTAASTTTSVLNVRFSTDDWQTSSAARAIDLTKAKKQFYRCGGFSDLGVYLDHTANLDCRLESVLARVE